MPVPWEGGGFQPNPILENTTGLLLCYDEIWFLTRDLCPVDMQKLPYVKFIEDDADLAARCVTASDQFKEILASASDREFPEIGELAGKTLETIKGGARFEMIWDHHNRGTTINGTSIGNGSPWVSSNAFIDAGISIALSESLEYSTTHSIDVVSNTAVSAALAVDTSTPAEHHGLQWWQREAVDFLSPVRSVTYLGPQGSYHESLEDLRAHRNIQDFRNYLQSTERADRDGERLAKEVSRLADKHARDVLEKFLAGRSKIATAGSIGAGVAGNALLPPFGSVVSGAISAFEWLRESRRRKSVSWSLFVLDLQKRGSL
ncbi:hypothetical protein ACFQ9J_28050 [Streptomyces sp. NPDC056529]|uniref:hypothetical protein n=1 Tax=Streptomyces sp. NPDC056529 TaxID=3345855 RepID=UPI0036C73DD9